MDGVFPQPSKISPLTAQTECNDKHSQETGTSPRVFFIRKFRSIMQPRNWALVATHIVGCDQFVLAGVREYAMHWSRRVRSVE